MLMVILSNGGVGVKDSMKRTAKPGPLSVMRQIIGVLLNRRG